MSMQVERLLSSVASWGGPVLHTIRARYPRCIHGEGKTHRVFTQDGRIIEEMSPDTSLMEDSHLSRNARSSRAVPVKTMLDEVRTNPFVPWHVGRNQRGMQAGEALSEEDMEKFRMLWLAGRDASVATAEALIEMDIHKQVINRLIEPYSWIDTLITATEWDNFLWLRVHEAAEPHMRDLAVMIQGALQDVTPQVLHLGQWHTPYVAHDEFDDIEIAKRVSSARNARISYAPFDGNPSVERELERYESLVGGDRIHASPTEHVATPAYGWHANFNGWKQFRKEIEA